MKETPIDMILHCPNCGFQHVDAPEDICPTCRHRSHPAGGCFNMASDNDCNCTTTSEPWTNPPHKSHLCHSCKTVWRPADVPTNGVATIRTKGEKDTWPT